MAQSVKATLTQARQVGADGSLIFQGDRADRLLETIEYGGDDQTGPWMTARYLCHMPGSTNLYYLVINSKQKGQSPRYTLEQLSEEELACVRALHPEWSIWSD